MLHMYSFKICAKRQHLIRDSGPISQSRDEKKSTMRASKTGGGSTTTFRSRTEEQKEEEEEEEKLALQMLKDIKDQAGYQ